MAFPATHLDNSAGSGRRDKPSRCHNALGVSGSHSLAGLQHMEWNHSPCGGRYKGWLPWRWSSRSACKIPLRVCRYDECWPGKWGHRPQPSQWWASDLAKSASILKQNVRSSGNWILRRGKGFVRNSSGSLRGRGSGGRCRNSCSGNGGGITKGSTGGSI